MIMIMLLLNLFLVGVCRSAEQEDFEPSTYVYPSEVFYRNGRLFSGGSKRVKIESAPFVVALVENDELGFLKGTFCTGAIISNQWVLSAAHCVHSRVKEFQVVAGCDSLKAILENDTCQGRNPIQLKMHPHYRSEGQWFDLVLIQVDSFVFGKGVNRIGLSRTWKGEGIIKDPQYGDEYSVATCQAYGWGMQNTNDSSKYVRKADFPCQHGKGGCGICIDDDLTSSMICSPPLSGKSVCFGDSGGPLVCDGVLAGVTHAMSKCVVRSGANFRMAVGCGLDHVFSIWTFICPTLKWIRRFISDAPDQPLSCRSSPVAVQLALVTGFSLLLILVPK